MLGLAILICARGNSDMIFAVFKNKNVHNSSGILRRNCNGWNANKNAKPRRIIASNRGVAKIVDIKNNGWNV